MMRRLKYKLNDYLEFILYTLAILCFIYSLNNETSDKVLQPILIIVTLTTIHAVIKITGTEIFPALRFSIFVFIFISMFLAVQFGFYNLIPGLDKLEHLLSGVLLVFVGFLILKHINRKEKTLQLSTLTIVLFCLVFAIAMAGCWEIFEYSVDKLLGFTTQGGSLDDTMQDIICGTSGAIVSSLFLNYRIKKHDIKFTLNPYQENCHLR